MPACLTGGGLNSCLRDSISVKVIGKRSVQLLWLMWILFYLFCRLYFPRLQRRSAARAVKEGNTPCEVLSEEFVVEGADIAACSKSAQTHEDQSAVCRNQRTVDAMTLACCESEQAELLRAHRTECNGSDNSYVEARLLETYCCNKGLEAGASRNNAVLYGNDEIIVANTPRTRFMDVLAPPTVGGTTAPGQRVETVAMALFDCTADDADELAFKKGELISLMQCGPELDWWEGYSLLVCQPPGRSRFIHWLANSRHGISP